MSSQPHDETHTADTCAECLRNRAAGTLTVHYWEPVTVRPRAREAMRQIELLTDKELRAELDRANPFADYSREPRVALMNTLLRYELGGPLLPGEGWAS